MKDKVSALFDGDLDDQGMRAVFDGMRKDASLRREWDTYCLIGDTLRGDAAGSGDFVSRVMASLDDEPTLLAPRAQPAAVTQRGLVHRLMPLAASVMGVAAVGLVAASLYRQDAPAPQMAVAASPIQLVNTGGCPSSPITSITAFAASLGEMTAAGQLMTSSPST